MQAIRAFLERAGLVLPGDAARFEPLAGGVSSDIWLVRAGIDGILREARSRQIARRGGLAGRRLAKRHVRSAGSPTSPG